MTIRNKVFGMRRPAWWYLATLCLAASVALSLDVFARSAPELHKGDWAYVGHDIRGTHYTALDQITPKNVIHLVKACAYTFPESVPSESTPVVVAGVLYVTSDHYTVAINGATCRVVWIYRWKPRARDRVHPNRGAAFVDGKIIRGTSDGFLIALDATTGSLLWETQVANPAEGYFISMPPLVHGNLIYIGPAGSESAGSGWVGAFRLSDGRQVWAFHIIPADGEPGAASWGPDRAARKHAGGAIWTPLSYDVQKNLLYVPTGNPAPDFYDNDRPGANLYTNSILALDGKTGRLVWYRQFISHDAHDYDITHVSPIFLIDSHTAIATSGKDGLLRVVDSDSHKILYKVPFTERLNADAPASFTPVRVCPGTLGGNEWNGPAYSPKLRLLVVPSIDQWCSMIKKDTQPPSAEKANAGEQRYFGGPINHDPYSQARGRLTGFDASTGKKRWRYEAPTPLVAGVALTASNLLFTGEVGGYFDALDAQTGQVLVHYDLSASIQGGVITYLAYGQQCVAVVSGNGGVLNERSIPAIKGGNPTVTIFALPKR